MVFYLSKILAFLTTPLIWVFILLVIALIKTTTKKAKRYLLGSLLLLYFFSNAFIFHAINSAWEVKPTANLQQHYSVAIVLGGVASWDRENHQIEFHGSADRILNVLPLYFSGKVDKILLSGGSGRIFPEEKESDVLADYLVRIGVKKEDLLLENQSRSTYENAVFTAKMIKEQNLQGNILLSTSAQHMNRAYACFKKQGLMVTPFSTDQVSYNRDYYFDTLFIPQAKVLYYWSNLIHEWVGLITYQLMGWV